MFYILAWAVVTLITLRIVQASLTESPRAMRAVTIGSVVVGIGFAVWLFVHWYMFDTSSLTMPKS
jgi:hypothetical protein